MAKRFFDTKMFEMPFFRRLKAPYKLFWQFLLCKCDHAGIWIVDMEVAQVYVGKDAHIDEKTALEQFNNGKERVHPFHNGERWFVTDFIDFQYEELSEMNRAHDSVLRLLQVNGLMDFLEVSREVVYEGKNEKLQGQLFKVYHIRTKMVVSPRSLIDKDDDVEVPVNSNISEKKQSDKELCEQAVQIFNTIGVSLPKITKITSSRKAHIVARLKEMGGTEVLERLMHKIEESDFLTGRSVGSDGRIYRADFDFVFVRKDRWLKTLEGSYENNRNNNKGTVQTMLQGSAKLAANNAVDRIIEQQFTNDIERQGVLDF